MKPFLIKLSVLAAAAGTIALSCGCQTAGGKKKNAEVAAQTGDPDRPTDGRPWNEAGSVDWPTSVGNSNSYSKVNTTQPYLALTFDDGPHPTHTPRLLDILKERNVKATFYVVGTRARSHPSILRRMISEGHEIANHTVTHGNLTKMSESGVRKEISDARDAILAATGVAPRTFRPPYGAITSAQKSWIRKEFDYPSILWSVDPMDWKRPGSSVVAQRLVSGARPGGILLVHDIHAPTIDAIPTAVDQLLEKGFQFVTVTELIAMEGS